MVTKLKGIMNYTYLANHSAMLKSRLKTSLPFSHMFRNVNSIDKKWKMVANVFTGNTDKKGHMDSINCNR
jgi:hypothetical protein